MIKKLLQGFVFGIGFMVAVLLIISLVNLSGISFTNESKAVNSGASEAYKDKADWRELNLTDKIEKTSGLALLRFNERENKHMAAYVEKVFTNDKSVKLPIVVGQRIEKSDYYAHEVHLNNRNGVLFIYSGNPPKKMEGAYLYNDRLVGLQDMPLNLFIEKFKALSDN